MSNWLKLLLAGLGGVGIGLGISRLVGRRREKKAALDDEARYNDGYHEGYSDGFKAAKDAADEDYGDGYNAGYEMALRGVKTAYRQGVIEDYVHSLIGLEEARKAVETYQGREPEGDTDGDIPVEANVDAIVKEVVDWDEDDTNDSVRPYHPEDFEPVPITEDEFNRNLKGYEIKNCIYYEIDETVYIPDDKELLTDPEGLLGVGFWTAFHGDPNNPVTDLYIENDTMGTLYHVELVDQAFCDVVEGLCGPEDE